MAGKALTRKSKAITLVPLALASAAWTTSIVTVGGATAARTGDGDLPGGAAVPSQAIEAPASVPVPGLIAPAVPNGATDQVIASASTNGIPSAALSAYQRGAQIMDAADTACNVPWELIAAIGRVESNHGTYGGNVLTEDGVSKPGIYGPQLNGARGTAAISDTDGGELDRDVKYDRAVGPMQFIPTTWSIVKVDADGDGKRNPQDIDDAALATAVYLCSGDDNLATRAGQERAVYRYNHSNAYVNLVLRIMEAYSQGDYSAIPTGTYGGTLFSPNYTAAIDAQEQQNHSSSGGQTSAPPTGPKPGGQTSTPPSGGTDNTPPPTTDGDPVTPPSGGSDGGSGDAVGEVIDKTTTTVKDLTGDLDLTPSSPSPSPSPTPTSDPVTRVEALAICAAKGVVDDPLTAVNELEACVAAVRS